MKPLIIGGLILFLVFGLKSKSRAERNNNPLNIREGFDGGDLWEGEQTIEIDAAFEEFISPVYGFRAATRILQNYRMQGYDTVSEIIHRWAPYLDGNDPAKYTKDVSAMTGFAPGRVIQPGDRFALLKAMSTIEAGGWKFNDAELSAGIAMAYADFGEY